MTHIQNKYTYIYILLLECQILQFTRLVHSQLLTQLIIITLNTISTHFNISK